MFKLRSRILAMLLLATTIITSIPLSSATHHAHAEETKVGDSADNKGAGDGGLDSSLSGNLSWYSKRQGYRIYIINSNHERISPVYDFYNSNPALDVPLENMCKTTRFDSAISPDDSFYQLNDFKTLKDWCKATTNPPLAVLNLGGGNYKGNGTAFKDWFFAGAEGTIHLDNGGSSKDNQVQKTTPKPIDGAVNTPTVTPAPQVEGKYRPNCTNCKGVGCEYCKYVKCGVCGREKIKVAPCEFCEAAEYYKLCVVCTRSLNSDGTCPICNPSTNDYIARVKYPDSHWKSTSLLPTPVQEKIRKASAVWNGETPELGKILNNNKLESFIQIFQADIEANFDYIRSIPANIHPDDAVDYAIGVACSNINQLYLDTMGSAVTGVFDLNSQLEVRNYVLIEAAERFKETAKYEDAFYASAEDIDLQPVYQALNSNSNTLKLASASSLLFTQIPLAGGDEKEVHTTNGKSPAYNLVNQTEHIKVEGYEYPSQAMEDGAYLVVEPITWLNRRTGTGAWDDPSQYTPYPVYGSYWNLVQGWVGDGGFYSTNMKELFNHCLITSKEVTSTGTDGELHTIKAVTDTSAKSVSKSVQLMKEGFGLSMHIYDADAATSTYDEDLGEEIGPSPDDSSKLSGDDKKNQDKYATIIKFYEDMTLKEDDEDKYHAFIRTPVPKAIKFEDESELTGYAIAEWFTTDTHFESVDNEARYESYKESNEILRDSEHWADYLGKEITLGDKEATEDLLEQSLIEREKSLVILYQNTGGTSTYDEPQSTNPAPAPDDSNQLTPDQALDHKYHTQIIKFYEEIDPTTDTVLNSEVHHRDPAPSLIDIEDEEEYEVKGWFTAKIEGHDASIDNTTTYESIKSTYPSVQSGDSTSTIELKVGKEATADTPAQECKENTLFVYLVKEGTPPPSDDGGTGILTQSKLTVKTTSDNSALNFTTKLVV